MVLDIADLRRDTLGINRVIHLNNAGAALMPTPVYQQMMAYLGDELTQGGYETAAAWAETLAQFYPAAARLINAQPHEIAYTDSATTAWQRAFYAIPWQQGDIILTSATAYASCYLAYLQVQRRYGVGVTVVPSDGQGRICLSALEAAISPQVRLIAIGHMPTHSGLVQPVAAVGQVARRHGILYLLDSCQSVGQYPVDVAAVGCDFLCATGRKYLRGPRGTGFLYARADTTHQLEPAMIDLHAARWESPTTYTLAAGARRFETWEANRAAQAGLTVALDYAQRLGLEAIWQRVQWLGQYLRRGLGAVPRVVVQDGATGEETELSGIVSFTVGGVEPHKLRGALQARAINLSVSGRGSTLLDMEQRGLTAVLRASVHYYNTEAELDQFCEVLEDVVAGFEG